MRGRLALAALVAAVAAAPADEVASLAGDDECSPSEGCSLAILQLRARRAAVPTGGDPPCPPSALDGLACVANRSANQTAVQLAVDWACRNMQGSFSCSGSIPEPCQADLWRVADYVFGTYVSLSDESLSDLCDFNGAAVPLDVGQPVSSVDLPCIVRKGSAQDQGKAGSRTTTATTATTTSSSDTPEVSAPSSLPGDFEASITHYSEFHESGVDQVAGGCMPSQFYEALLESRTLARETPYLEGWYQAAAPIWMTQPMHGRNSNLGGAALETKTTWFDYTTKKPHVPQGPGTGMMFDGGPPVDGYETSDGCWEATWDDPSGKPHRVGLAVLDNCGHSDGVQNSLTNIKWCVPFEFTDKERGATCPLRYFDKCFPEKQAVSYSERLNCATDPDVTGDMKVTNDAPWAKMVIGTYTETWCPKPSEPSSCHAYNSPASARLNNSITWSGEGSRAFHSVGRCSNRYAGTQDMPELGSCTADVRGGDRRCRNAYGFPYHFDIGTYRTGRGEIYAPPWGRKNTRVRDVKRRVCPMAVKAAYLKSCGRDMYLGNNVVFGSAEASYVPDAWCKTTKEECMASALYPRSSREYLDSTGYALCCSEKCGRIHAIFGRDGR